jgi:hypothetical protein
MLFTQVSDDYWAHFLSINNEKITIYKFLSLPEANETYEVKFDYFISAQDNNDNNEKIDVFLIKHSTSDANEKDKRIKPEVQKTISSLKKDTRTS